MFSMGLKALGAYVNRTLSYDGAGEPLTLNVLKPLKVLLVLLCFGLLIEGESLPICKLLSTEDCEVAGHQHTP